ncbi:hypothetical protein WR25_19084 isoform B [Diploscapter pachys]|nr:hypothetical protein WR25_19084 isoform B [Diploscapter pachys]
MIERYGRLLKRSPQLFLRFHRQKSELWERIKDNVFMIDKENFCPEFIQRAHNWDKIPNDKWLLIYRDKAWSNIYFWTSWGIPLIIVMSAGIIWDIAMHPKHQRFDISNKIVADYNEAGVLVYIPLLGMCLMPLVLCRAQQMRLFRIYQNRADPDVYVAIVPKFVVFQGKMPFDRMKTGFDYMEDELPETQRFLYNFAFGNAKIDKRRFSISPEYFREFNYK